MAETVSDKDVTAARKRVDKLREQIEDEQTKASVSITEAENTIRLARLDAEEQRLQAHLGILKEQNNKAALREAVKETVDQISEGQLAAVPAPGGGTVEEEK
jgi:hypothetical protein